LSLVVALSQTARSVTHAPSWLAVATEALQDLAHDASLRIRDVANHAGVHPVHLARVFADHHGCSPGNAIRRLRIERAVAMLSTTRSLADVAADAGFADQSHMTRCFRAVYGATPSRMRSAFG
jgi:AraC family transcriptional regulator